MMQLAQANWLILLAALLIGLIVAWLLFRSNRKTTIARGTDTPEDGAPARRNQALIDAPPVAAGAVGGAAVAAKGAAVSAEPEAPAVQEETLASDEPSDPAVDPDPAPAIAPASAPVETTGPAPSGTADDLKRIKGVGPKLAALLNELGVTSFAQIAAWDDAEVDRIDAELGRFQGRIRRDDWRTQARFLAAGDTSGYESEFGKL